MNHSFRVSSPQSTAEAKQPSPYKLGLVLNSPNQVFVRLYSRRRTSSSPFEFRKTSRPPFEAFSKTNEYSARARRITSAPDVAPVSSASSSIFVRTFAGTSRLNLIRFSMSGIVEIPRQEPNRD